MSDYSELKRLAEYATPGPWVAQHPNAGQRGSEVASEGGLNQVCADLGPSNALYIAAANPAAVLAMIAEVEALRKDAERYRWLRDKQTFIWLIQDWFPSTAEFIEVDALIDAAMTKGAKP